MEETILNLIETALNITLENRNLEFCNQKNINEWDSLNMMNLVVLLEEEFNIELFEDDINDIMQSGKNIITILNKKGIE